MGECAAVLTGALAELGYLLISLQPAAEPSIVDRGLGCIITGALMVKHFLIFLIYIPWGLLDVLGHMGQIDLGFLRGWRVGRHYK